MPQALGALIGGIVGFFGTGVGGFIATTALQAGLSVGASLLLRKKPGVQPRDLIIRSGAQPQMVVYGKSAVAGVLTWMNQKEISGDDNFELWVVITHAGHEVESMDDFIYEAELLESGSELTWSSDETDVNSGIWHADDASHEACRIWRRLGTDTQTLPTDLTDLGNVFTELGNSPLNHHGKGLAYSVHRFQIFDESEEVFKGNQPSNIRAIVEGRKIYDPRLDSTQVLDDSTSPVTTGSGAHRADDSDTWEYSNNPILCAADYMMTYWGFDESRFDWGYIADQADKCDVNVPVPPSASPENVQPRFFCNGVISLGDSHDDNLDKILQTCWGRRYTSNGKIRLQAGGLDTATFSITTDMILSQPGPGPVVRTALARTERYNRVAATYQSAELLYTATEMLPVEDASFVTRDNGEEITHQLDFQMVSDEYQAQRLAYYYLQKSDQQLRVELPLSWAGLRCTAGTYVNVTYDKFNWVAKLFLVESVKIGIGGVPVSVVLREDSSTAWTDPEVNEYTTRTAAGEIVPPTRVVPAPTSMTVTQQTGGNLVEWVNPAREAYDYIEVYASATSAWSGASVVATGITATNFFHNLADATTRYYWVRAFKNGVESNREPNSDTSDRTATVPTVGSGTDAISVAISSSNGVAWVQAPDGGAWTPAGTTTDVTFTFYQGGSAIATHVIRFTRSGNSISAATQSETGNPTTETITNNNTGAVTARVTHDSSGISSAQSVIAVEGGSQGSTGAPGDGSDGVDGQLPIAAFGGQWGAFGDILLTPNLDMTGSNPGEIRVESMGGSDYLVFGPDDQSARTGTRFALLTPWEGDTSTTLEPVGDVFYVICGDEDADDRFNGNFQSRPFFTATYNSSTGVWTAYPNSTSQGVTFTPLSTDAVIAVGYKDSTSPAGTGITSLTNLTVNMSLDSSTATLFLSSASISSALIQDAAIGEAKIANLAVANGKIANLAVDSAKLATAAVTTLKIEDDAVTVPVGNYSDTQQVVTWNSGAGEQIGSVSLNSEQQPVLFQCYATVVRGSGSDQQIRVGVKRNGSWMWGYRRVRVELPNAGEEFIITWSWYDSAPPSGSNTYEAWLNVNDSGDQYTVRDRTIWAAGMKK